MALMPGMRRAAASKSEYAESRFSSGRVGARLRSGGEGQSLVEFALVLPLLLMLVFGLFYFGLYIAYFQSLAQAVGAGGQTLAHERGNTTNPCADALTAIENASPLLINPSKITLTVTFTPYGGSPVALGGNSCAGLSTDSNTELGGKIQGGNILVGASYTFPCPIPWSKIVCSPLYAQVQEYVY